MRFWGSMLSVGALTPDTGAGLGREPAQRGVELSALHREQRTLMTLVLMTVWIESGATF